MLARPRTLATTSCNLSHSLSCFNPSRISKPASESGQRATSNLFNCSAVLACSNDPSSRQTLFCLSYHHFISLSTRRTRALSTCRLRQPLLLLCAACPSSVAALQTVCAPTAGATRASTALSSACSTQRASRTASTTFSTRVHVPKLGVLTPLEVPTRREARASPPLRRNRPLGLRPTLGHLQAELASPVLFALRNGRPPLQGVCKGPEKACFFPQRRSSDRMAGHSVVIATCSGCP